MTKTTARFWLAKSEPDVYSIDDLARDGREMWDGIRNYQARNFMRDDMKIGDWVLFYHSNAKPPGVAGLAKVASEPYPDPTQFDEKSKYFDPKASEEKPRWILIDVEFVERFNRLLSLAELKEEKPLDGMLLLRRGTRLSIQPVEKKQKIKSLKLILIWLI